MADSHGVTVTSWRVKDGHLILYCDKPEDVAVCTLRVSVVCDVMAGESGCLVWLMACVWFGRGAEAGQREASGCASLGCEPSLRHIFSHGMLQHDRLSLRRVLTD